MKYLINNIQTNWKGFLDIEFKKPYFIKLDEFLANQTKIIYPKKEDIFACFNFFNIESTRVVIFGQDPYINENQAIGLAFGIGRNAKIPPSLRNIAKELKNDLNIILNDYSLINWAKQGILLLNTKLTVFKGESNSHQKIGWEHFIYDVIEQLNKVQNPIVFVLLGNDAKKLAHFIDDSMHHIISCAHPSPLSFYKGFENSKIFSAINSFLIDKIKW